MTAWNISPFVSFVFRSTCKSVSLSLCLRSFYFARPVIRSNNTKQNSLLIISITSIQLFTTLLRIKLLARSYIPSSSPVVSPVVSPHPHHRRRTHCWHPCKGRPHFTRLHTSQLHSSSSPLSRSFLFHAPYVSWLLLVITEYRVPSRRCGGSSFHTDIVLFPQ